MEVNFDGCRIVTEQDFHHHLAMALGVQKFYGYNLDALWDLLSANVERPLVLRWNDHEASRRSMGCDFDRVVQVLERVRLQDECFGWVEKFSYILD
ncbi:Barstar [compost metagenome]